MKYRFYKIFSISALERKLFFEAWRISFFTRWMLILFPFKKYSKKLGERGKIALNQQEVDPQFLLEVAHAIKRGVKYSLWRNKCLEQAITAKKMLKKRNINSTIYFGVRKPEDKLEAHAWLKVGEVFVVGQKGYQSFTIVAWYS